MSQAPTITRRRLPDERRGFTRKGKVAFQQGEVKFYVTASFFADGDIGEVFVKISREGSELAGWVNAWATAVSIALQHGCPWQSLRTKFLNQVFGEAVEFSTLHAITAAIDSIIEKRGG